MILLRSPYRRPQRHDIEVSDGKSPTMKLDSTLSDRILKALANAPSRIEELVYSFPDVTWNQVFYEVNRLSRNGRVLLMFDARGAFTVRRQDECKAARGSDERRSSVANDTPVEKISR